MKQKQKPLRTPGLLIWSGLLILGLNYLLINQAALHILLPITIAQAILTWPFSVKTGTGKRWWALYIGFVACLVGAVSLGPTSALAWILISISGMCAVAGCYLRWNPPSGLGHDGRPLAE